MNLKLATLFVLCTSTCGALGQSNASFYVSPTGSDSNAGTQTAPWRTVQHAADTAHAGSTVNVRGGVYEELVSINASGNASDGYITLRSYPGETPILDAGHFTPSERTAVLTIQIKSYVRIEGLEIRNFHTAEHRLTPLGISVIGSGSHIELLKNNVHHIEQTFPGRDAPGSGGNGFGIAVYGTDAKTPISELVIDSNEVHHLQTSSSESLVVNGNVTIFRITHNVVHDNNNIGIGRAKRAAPDSRIRDLGVVHPPELVSAGPQEHGALQYPVADAVETRLVPSRPAHTVRPAAAEEDQAADRRTVASLPSAAGTRIIGKRRRDR